MWKYASRLASDKSTRQENSKTALLFGATSVENRRIEPRSRSDGKPCTAEHRAIQVHDANLGRYRRKLAEITPGSGPVRAASQILETSSWRPQARILDCVLFLLQLRQ